MFSYQIYFVRFLFSSLVHKSWPTSHNHCHCHYHNNHSHSVSLSIDISVCLSRSLSLSLYFSPSRCLHFLINMIMFLFVLFITFNFLICSVFCLVVVKEYKECKNKMFVKNVKFNLLNNYCVSFCIRTYVCMYVLC